MLIDATELHPAAPELAEALDASLQEMREQQDELYALMAKAKEKFGPLPDATPIRFGDGVELPYIDPEMTTKIKEFTDQYGAHIVEDLKKAVTLEAQENLLLQHMRDVAELSVLDGVNRYQATCMIQTIQLLFDKMEETGTPLTEPVDAVKLSIEYYAQILHDSMECGYGLAYRWQRAQGIADKDMLNGPYSVALKQLMHPLHVVGKEPGYPENERVQQEARYVFQEMLEPYLTVLPTPLSTDMMGLVLRCTEQLGEAVLHKARFPGARDYANENMPEDTETLLNNPLIRRRVNHILGQVFLKHPDAPSSPHQMMEAAQSLEIAIAMEQRRHERATHGI